MPRFYFINKIKNWCWNTGKVDNRSN